MGYVDIRYKRVMCSVIALFISSFIVNMFLRYGFCFSYLSMSVYDIGFNIEKDSLQALVYLVIHRLEQLFVVVLCMKLLNADYVYNAIICLLSAMFGVMVTVQTYYEGITGVFLLILYVVPHYIAYIIFLWLLRDSNDRRNLEQKNAKRIIALTILFVIGIVSECFFSRFFLKQFYQYMVTVQI